MSAVADAIAYVEEQFECADGAYWAWADVGMTKPYQRLELELDIAVRNSDEAEHRLVQRFINEIRTLKAQTGFGPDTRPKLWWRWKDKVRLLDDSDNACYTFHDGEWVKQPMLIVSRLYIDGNPGYRHGNPSRPSGSPAAGQVKVYQQAQAA